MARYTGNESDKENSESKKSRGSYDLLIKSHDFKIEIKYLKNWRSNSNTPCVSKGWREFKKDFEWLMDEIDAGNKNKVAFVIGWFNCVDSFSKLLQLGTGGGSLSQS